jgi:uncharacterized protein
MSQKIKIGIKGMHCKACEILTEDRLKQIKNIQKVEVSHIKGEAEITFDSESPNIKDIATSLSEIGYQLKDEGAEKDDQLLDQNNKKRDLSYWFSIIASIIIIYWLLNRVHILEFGSLMQDGFSISMALLVGLVAGLSTCLALVGGLILSVSANYAKNHPNANKLQKIKPQIFFNLGRIFGFFLLGGILGLIGSTFKISTLLNSLITIAVGGVIFILGLKLLDISPTINKFNITLPKKLGRIMKIDNPWLLGALTFFLPCGFTQAMQVYALGSGNFMQAGLIMSLFAIGTTPGLLGIGSLGAFANKKKSKLIFLLIGIVVVAFGLFNLVNGYRLWQVTTGGFSEIINLKSSSNNTTIDNPDLEIVDGVRIIRMREHNRGYSPNYFVIFKDQPVKWIINAEAPYSCASALVVPSLKIQTQLKAGENILEFTPDKTGEIRFSCSMGMYSGKFVVTDDPKALR